MTEYIGNVAVPAIVPSGTFPIVSDFGHSMRLDYRVAVHRFGSANAKIEQRFLLGTGARRFTVRKARATEAEREALRDFWETNYGPYGAFTYNLPNDNGIGTTAVTCRFENEPLSWEFLSDQVSSLGVTLVEIPDPDDAPTYALNSTVTRFPSVALSTALLSQVQVIIPLIKIQPRESGYPAIYISDRRCTIGAQLYLPRLLRFDGISQGLGSEADQAQFVLGNADQVMTLLTQDTDLTRARLEFSLFHVGTGIKLDLWAGDINDWTDSDGNPEFAVSAADGLYELNLPYPVHRISRTCWKMFDDGNGCPYTGNGSLDLTHFPNALAGSCDKGYDSDNGCLAHTMEKYFGGILAEPQTVTVKDNSTGTWGYGRSNLTSASIVNDSVYDKLLPEIYTDVQMPVNCLIAAGREESDFYVALGIVGRGPIVFGSGHQLDGQYHHGYPGALGLRQVVGNDPVNDLYDFFSMSQAGAGGDPAWRWYSSGGWAWKRNYSAGIAFLELRRADQKGLQLSRPTDHQMKAIVLSGLKGWVWSGAGARSWLTLTNPIWIAVNAMLESRGLKYASAATAETYFDVASAVASAAICDLSVTPLVKKTVKVWIPENPPDEGYWEDQEVTSEIQFPFRGIVQDAKPLRDWIAEILANCNGYWTNTFGKMRFGIRCNSSVVSAFTEGNILFRSLQLAPLKPAFNRIVGVFGDSEYDFTQNTVTLYEEGHAKASGSATEPLFLDANINLCGACTKSQVERIIATRLREELGGITSDQWRDARQITFKTTVLALETEAGMVCSMTHPKMPNGSGEFRIGGWRLNNDYSIDVDGRTTVDEMYDLTAGPKPPDVQADPVPVEVPRDIRSIGNLTAAESFVQDDVNADLYRRKITASFSVPPTTFENTFTGRPTISGLSVLTTGGTIPGDQSLYLEVCAQKSGVDGLPSLCAYVVIPAGTDTNSFSFDLDLPDGADAYVVRIGPKAGRCYKHSSAALTTQTLPITITVTDVSSLDETSLSPDPRFHHARISYRFGAGELKDAGATDSSNVTEYTFEPEVPRDETEITVFAQGCNQDESDIYPIASAPSATVMLTQDSGNPSGASDLEVSVESQQIICRFNRDTSNYKTISRVAVVVSTDTPAQGPQADERTAHAEEIIQSGSGAGNQCHVTANSGTVTFDAGAKPSDTDAVGRLLVTFTDDPTPDTDLNGNVITTQGADTLTLAPKSVNRRTGTYDWAIIKRFYDYLATGETTNVLYREFTMDQIGDPEQAIWQLPPVAIGAGTYYVTIHRRNIFGLGIDRLVYGPFTVPPLLVQGLQNYVISGCAAGTPNGLNLTSESGSAFISGKEVSVLETTHGYTASKYTTDDLQEDGTITHTEYDTYADIPAQAAAGLRLRMVYTDGSAIQGVFDYRTTEPLLQQHQRSAFDWEKVIAEYLIEDDDYPAGTAHKFNGAYRYAAGNGINWYFSNVGLYYLAERMDLDAIKDYLDCYIANLLNDYSAQDVNVNVDYSLDVDASGDPDPPKPPDSHDSYASTFLMLAVKYVRLSNDWAWLDEVNSRFSETNLNTLLNICVYNLTTQIKTTAWASGLGFPTGYPSGTDTLLISPFQNGYRAQDSFTYYIGLPADNCENYHGLKDFGELLTDIGDANAATILAHAANIGVAVHGCYDANLRTWIWNDSQITWTQGTPDTWVSNAATIGTALYPDLFAGVFAELHDVPSASGAIYDKLRYNDGWDRLNYYAPSWWERTDYSSFAEMYYAYIAAKHHHESLIAAKAVEKFEKYYLTLAGSDWKTGATSGYALISEIGFAQATRDLLITRLAAGEDSKNPYCDLLVRGLTSLKAYYPPSKTQMLDSASTIQPTTTCKYVGTNADVTLASTPNIAAGKDGQQITLVNSTAYFIELQDESVLSGSGLALGCPNWKLRQWDSITLIYLESAGKWIRFGSGQSLLEGPYVKVIGDDPGPDANNGYFSRRALKFKQFDVTQDPLYPDSGDEGSMVYDSSALTVTGRNGQHGPTIALDDNVVVGSKLGVGAGVNPDYAVDVQSAGDIGSMLVNGFAKILKASIKGEKSATYDLLVNGLAQVVTSLAIATEQDGSHTLMVGGNAKFLNDLEVAAGALLMSALTGDRFLALNSSKQVYSTLIDLTGTYFQNVLPESRGGTGASSRPYYTQAEVDSLIMYFATKGSPGAGTVPLAKITAGGSDGSITVNSEGIVTGYTAPT